MAGPVVVSGNKAYSFLSEDEFIERYELLCDYLDENKNSNLQKIIEGLKNLPRYHPLHNTDFFVKNKKNGKSFLHLGAGSENITLINFLKQIGHDINLLDHLGRTPLYDACYATKLQSVISIELLHNPTEAQNYKFQQSN
jgi:ankyrin repeat protein